MKTFVCNLILQLQLFPIFRKLWRCVPKRPSSRASSSPSATSTPSWPKGGNLDLRQEYQLLLKLMFLLLFINVAVVLLLCCYHSPKRRKFGPQVEISIIIEIDVSVFVGVIYYCCCCCCCVVVVLLLLCCCCCVVVVVLLSQSKKEEIWTSG